MPYPISGSCFHPTPPLQLQALSWLCICHSFSWPKLIPSLVADCAGLQEKWNPLVGKSICPLAHCFGPQWTGDPWVASRMEGTQHLCWQWLRVLHGIIHWESSGAASLGQSWPPPCPAQGSVGQGSAGTRGWWWWTGLSLPTQPRPCLVGWAGRGQAALGTPADSWESIPGMRDSLFSPAYALLAKQKTKEKAI